MTRINSRKYVKRFQGFYRIKIGPVEDSQFCHRKGRIIFFFNLLESS